MLSVKNLTKIYKLGKGKGAKRVVALDNVSIDFPDKGLVFLLGKSGSGKSTLLNSIGGLDSFDSGEIIIKGKSSKDFKQSDFDSYRNTFIGFIFQEYNILDEFSVGKNLALALELQGKRADKQAVEELLEQVDLSGYYKRKPNQLSGGQKQRVAIARALIKDPEIIMADEPTGALDSNTGKQVMETLKKLSKSKLVIIVSHDREFAHLYGDRVVELKDGKIISDETKKEVQAQKGETGVSFIEDKIVHIKKGQTVTKQDYEKILKLIAANSKKADTIISFDNKTNSEVKKTAFITDDGNQEVFKDTLPADIRQSDYDPDDFKLIKSRLRLKDSVKMGASSLKHKPIRLILTVLLACVAFTMFGVVNTLACFSRGVSVFESVRMLNLNSIAVTRVYGEGYDSSTGLISSAELERIKSQNSSFADAIQPVLSLTGNYSFENCNSSYDDPINSTICSGLMAINQDVLSNMSLNLVEGRLPTNAETEVEEDTYWGGTYIYREIAVSKHIYNVICKANPDLTFEQISQMPFSINGIRFFIVGVIDDETNMDRYSGLSQAQMREWNVLQELQTITNYGLYNMCFINPDYFNSLYEDYISSDIRLYYESSNGGYNSIYSPKTYSMLSEYSLASLEMKNGVDPAHLTRNQIIIPSGSSYGDFSMEDINKGATFKAGFSYDNLSQFEFEVVGICSWDETVFSDEFFWDTFHGYDYIVAKLKNNNSDRNLVLNFENYSKDGASYHLQFATTPVLDQFGNMINGMKTPLFWVGVVLAVFAGLMLMNFIATSISYKKREIGILRAIGARGKDVFSIFFSESFIICIINFVLSAIATAVCCFFINRGIIQELHFAITLLSFGVTQILLLFAISFIVAFLSSFLPVFKIARKMPIDSINNR